MATLSPTTLTQAQAQAQAQPQTSSESRPLEHTIRDRLTTHLAPTHLTIHNDSHLHAHHAAMKGSTSPETHFRVTVVSASFEGMKLAQRHRLVYGLLKDEMAREGGIHALQLRCKTGAEVVRDGDRETGGKT